MTPWNLAEAMAEIGKAAAWLGLALRGLVQPRYCFEETIRNFQTARGWLS